MVRVLAVSCLLILFAQLHAHSQVIDADDLSYFAARFPCEPDPDDPRGSIIRVDSMIEWCLLKSLDDLDRPGFSELKKEAPEGTCWLRSPGEQGDEFRGSRWSGQMFSEEPSPHMFQRIHVLGDAAYMSYGRSVLTFWEQEAIGTLRYAGACVNPAQQDAMLPVVVHVSAFSDGSVWACLKSVWADAWDVSERYSFIRERDPGQFEVFHTINWNADYSWKDQTRTALDFHHCRYPSHQVLTIKEHFSADYVSPFKGAPKQRIMTIDSASAEAIDIWQLAQKHFGIGDNTQPDSAAIGD